MAEEKKEPWLNYLALTTVIFAVCATLSTLKGGGYGSKAVMAQAQASDQWSYYQAKSIKGYLYDLQRERMELDARTLKGGSSRAVAAEFEKRAASYKEKVEKYDKEKEEIKKKADDLEARRDDSQKHSGAFGLAAMFLQIAILLSSIAALMKQKYFWFIGIGAGCVGILYFVNGFILFF
jgi:hypothetical protein